MSTLVVFKPSSHSGKKPRYGKSDVGIYLDFCIWCRCDQIRELDLMSVVVVVVVVVVDTVVLPVVLGTTRCTQYSYTTFCPMQLPLSTLRSTGLTAARRSQLLVTA